MGDLSFENIFLDTEETFLSESESVFETSGGTDDEGQGNDDKDTTKKRSKSTEVNPNTLFASPESVGDEDNQGDEGSDSDDDEETAANGFYSSIASALVDDGILSSIDKEALKDVKDADSFSKLIEAELDSRLEEEQKRIKKALETGLEPSEILKYENTLKFLDSITEDNLTEDTDDAELRRKQIIYQDYINKGFSSEKAVKEVEKSINAGSDIDDALEALEANKEYYNKQYNALVEAEQSKLRAEEDKTKQRVADLKKAVLDTDEPFPGITLDKTTRNIVYDLIANSSVKGKDGNMYTAVQNYQVENPTEFLHKIGLLFHLTDGFKSINKLVKPTVNKEKHKSLRDLENVINNTRVSGGSPTFTSGVDDDNDSETYSGLSLDIS